MEFSDYLRFVLALVFVLSLIGALAWLGRRLGAFPGIPKRRQGQRRLRTVESLTLDARRRLILVQRDNVEHLILLGTTAETVIENGIAVTNDAAGTTIKETPEESDPSARGALK